MTKKEFTARSCGVLLGAHMSIAGGMWKAFDRAVSLGCSTMQIFVKNSTQWKIPPLKEEERVLFLEKQHFSGISPILAHSSYLVNLAAKNALVLRRSRRAFKEELLRCEVLGIQYFVLHPGAHMGTGESEGIKRVAESLNEIHDETSGCSVVTTLETTAGQGTSLGSTFEQLRTLIDRVEKKHRIAVCVDTCHIFAAGYDIRTERTYEATVQQFDEIIGLKYLVAFHVNDSQKELGSRIDRHAHIGKGRIGLTAFRMLMNDERFVSVPKILETPKGDEIKEDKRNMKTLLRLIR